MGGFTQRQWSGRRGGTGWRSDQQSAGIKEGAGGGTGHRDLPLILPREFASRICLAWHLLVHFNCFWGEMGPLGMFGFKKTEDQNCIVRKWPNFGASDDDCMFGQMVTMIIIMIFIGDNFVQLRRGVEPSYPPPLSTRRIDNTRSRGRLWEGSGREKGRRSK